jgi:transposase
VYEITSKYVYLDSSSFHLHEAYDWLMRVPETLSQAKLLVKDTLAANLLELEPGYRGKEVDCEYAGVKQRWLVVFLAAAEAREMKTLEKAQAKELETTPNEWRKIEGQTLIGRCWVFL